MNEFKEKAVKHYIDMNYLFLSLLKERQFDDESIRLMKQNHSMMQSALIDLGVTFTDNEKIRSLNEKIRELENSQNSDGFNYQKVSTYIQNINKSLKEAFEEKGLYCTVNTSFNPNIQVEIGILSSSPAKSNSTYWKDENEYNEHCRKNEERHNNFLKNFNVIEEDNEQRMVYDMGNINLILTIAEETLGLNMSYFNYDLYPNFCKINGKHTLKMPTIRTFKIGFTTLASHKSFQESLKEYKNY